MTTSIDVTIRIGGVFATDREAVIRTVLGSCIAVCLYDPISRVGGMNHFMLPSPEDSNERHDLTRFGVNAMEVLIGSCQRLGARRDRLLAKLFGGGHVLNTANHEQSVPVRNIAFIEEFVNDEGLRVVSRDLGGSLPRRVHFYPHSGKVLVKRLAATMIPELQIEERAARRAPVPVPANDIELFDD